MAETSDATAREAALDPTRSFIVQAPAGSGKTELLIQRHLLLLTRVAQPEQVVAVTFTRKAAAEMRARVLDTLELAADGEIDLPVHRKLGVQIAVEVLARDRQLGWNILAQPGRLKIQTVDAVNSALAERLPVASGAIHGAALIDDASLLHHEAARRALESALTDRALTASARELLAAADNSFEAVISGIAAIMPMRDQWVELLAADEPGAVRRILADGLGALARGAVAELEALAGSDRIAELTILIDFANGSGSDSDADSDADSDFDTDSDADAGVDVDTNATRDANSDANWNTDANSGTDSRNAARDDDVVGSRLDWWQSAAGMLLTKSGGWRKSLNVRDGFPADRKDMKQRALQLIAALREIPGFAERLAEVSGLPGPVPEDALVVRSAAALQLLLRALAELKVLFQEEGSVDFVELALAAHAALGTVDEPSDLLLALDHRIEHLLVDEFQDTSHSQFRLLERLTSGWTAGDGRTLFLVGDPMQSIYRFRDADVGLFMTARRGRLGQVPLEPLRLSSNYRSAPAVTTWVNETFLALFPPSDDGRAGRVAYDPFVAAGSDASPDGVRLYRLPDSSLEAQHQLVAQLAAEEVARGDGSIAILVQSRSHLRGLRRLLNAAHVPVRAVELDILGEQPAIQDLLALTRALLHPADRIAWLAVLRAPWCALSWTALHRLCGGEREAGIWALLTADDASAGLLPAEQERLAWFVRAIEEALARRGSMPLADWIESCWQRLDGPATLTTDAERQQVRRFLAIVDGLSVRGDLPDVAAITEALKVPFSEGDGGGDGETGAAAVEIMTVHRAKGLEFESVILFGLDRQPRPSEKRVLYWHGLGDGHTLFSAPGAGSDRLTDYLRRIDRVHEREEQARLLYVAVTRARRRLHLIGALDEERRAPRGTLMAWLEPRFREPHATRQIATDSSGQEDSGDRPDWWTAPLEALHPLPADDSVREVPAPGLPDAMPYDWASPVAAHVGTVVHRVLHRAASSDADTTDGSADVTEFAAGFDPGGEAEGRRFRQELELLGVPPDALDGAVARVVDVLAAIRDDETGRWILRHHTDAQSEYSVALLDGGRVVHLQIDRTFVDAEGTRWIIDYKTSRHAGGDTETFLDTEVDRYRHQLETYARAMRLIDPRPVRVGLYFPLLRAFRAWTPAAEEGGKPGPGSPTTSRTGAQFPGA